MTYKTIINKTKVFIENYMNSLNDISHDFNHIKLVVNLALKIAKKEGLTKQRDIFHITMGSLLHDYGDSKYSNESQEVMIKDYLKQFKKLKIYDKNEITRLASNISLSKDNLNNFNHSYHNYNKHKRQLKLFIIQDADRINSLGAIGIMRYITFNINNYLVTFGQLNLIKSDGIAFKSLKIYTSNYIIYNFLAIDESNIYFINSLGLIWNL